MLKKFAVLAAMAAFIVACGPSAEEIQAKAQAVADSLAAVVKADSMKAAEEAAAAAAAAQAAMDTMAAAATEAAPAAH
ncbi:MAG TPA: hypothetical protein PK760_11920 [Flavobacteriales bacterium]|nr:hypothetical protein [Flavobacteriales bacterium]